MTKLNRRSMLAGVAAMPFLPDISFASQRHHSSGTRWLYAYIHGAFVIEFQPGGVRLLAPKIADNAGNLLHEYRAGYLPNGEGTPLDAAGPVALTGFLGASTYPQIDKTTIPCLDKVTVGATGSVYVGTVLPTPDAIVPLRQVSLASDKTPFFTIRELKDLTWLPLLLVLQYELQPTDHPALVGAGAGWRDDGRNPLILHLRAEPGTSSNAFHDAIPELRAIVNKPQLKLNDCYVNAFTCAKNTEEQNLLEIRNPSPVCTPALACAKESKEDVAKRGRPANCVGIVVNNTGN
jgi:hypothetical protein